MSEREIPRVIHQIYFGGESAAPPSYRQYAATWRQHHPEWEFQFWDAARCRDLVETHYPSFLPVYDGYRHRIQRCDAIRYFILHQYGGVYLDMDIECLRPIDELVAGRELLLGAGIRGYTNAVMGSVAGHPLWPRVFETLRLRRKRFSSAAPLWAKLTMPMYIGYSTGPLMLADCVREGGDDRAAQTRVCPSYFFEPLAPRADMPPPASPEEVDLSQSYANHHMSMHWLPLQHKLLSALFGLLARPYWKSRMSKASPKPP